MRGELAQEIRGRGGRSSRRGVRLALTALALAALAALWAGSAEACGVCISASDETRMAYYITTALMMALPFLFLGSLAFLLVRGARNQRHPQDAARASPR